MLFYQNNPLIAIAIAIVVIVFVFRRPKLSLSILLLALILSVIFNLVIDLSSSGVSKKEKLIKGDRATDVAE